jgi:hypothetical protein
MSKRFTPTVLRVLSQAGWSDGRRKVDDKDQKAAGPPPGKADSGTPPKAEGLRRGSNRR